MPVEETPGKVERHITLINKAFQSYDRRVSPDLLEDAQKAQLFLDEVQAALGILPVREKQALELHYALADGNILSLTETGKNIPNLKKGGIGIPREQTRQLELKGLRKLSHPPISRRFRQFLVDVPSTNTIP